MSRSTWRRAYDADDADETMGNVRMGNSLLADDDDELMGEPEGSRLRGSRLSCSRLLSCVLRV